MRTLATRQTTKQLQALVDKLIAAGHVCSNKTDYLTVCKDSAARRTLSAIRPNKGSWAVMVTDEVAAQFNLELWATVAH